MAKIEIEVKNVGGSSTWREEYNCEGDPQKYADNLIAGFNATLREYDSPREVVGVKVIDASNTENTHNWRKVNLVTISHAGRQYDKYECETCGITSKRYGIGAIVRDSKYKAKKYDKCRTV